MLMKRVIPCLDVRAGRVVKGVRFQNLRDAGDPAELAARYQAQGADEITVLDVSATPEERAASTETVSCVRRALSVPLTVGGGVRTIDDIGRLLDAGADKVGINTAATTDPELITRASERFGAQCIVVAIDAQADVSRDGVWRVVVRSGTLTTALDALEWAREVTERGAGEILLTSWDRDGTGSGYDLELTGSVAASVGVPVIASGGASGPADLLSALRAGAEGVLAAGIFHTGACSVRDVKAYLAAQGEEIRL